MKKPTTISTESVSEYREFVQLRLRACWKRSSSSSRKKSNKRLAVEPMNDRASAAATGMESRLVE